MSWKACELVWQRGWRCTISASGSTIGSAVPVWPLPICWDGDLNSHQAFKGRKRHILVDTQGLVIEARLHGAQIQDREGIKLLLDANARERLPERLSHLWLDAG